MKELIFSATKKDFRIDWYSGTGAGGQYRNKHPNCCRITHKDSGLMETGQSHRSRQANFREAFHKLAKRLSDYYVREENREAYKSSEVVRTYNKPDNRVKDHASSYLSSWDNVMGKEDLSGMITERWKAKNL